MINDSYKHTPGPWRASGDASTNLGVYVGENDTPRAHIAEVFSGYCRVGEAMANAMLIASAPSMLETIEICANQADYALRYKHGDDVKALQAALLRIKHALEAVANEAHGRRGILWCDTDFAKSLRVRGLDEDKGSICPKHRINRVAQCDECWKR